MFREHFAEEKKEEEKGMSTMMIVGIVVGVIVVIGLIIFMTSGPKKHPIDKILEKLPQPFPAISYKGLVEYSELI